MHASAILILAASTAGLLASLGAAAQSNPYNGNWHATFKTARGVERDGMVVIENEGGSWDMNTQNRNNPCAGRKFPIVVQKASADELTFLVNGSKALAGCPDTPVTFKPVDAATLKGTVNDTEFTLTKK